MEAQNKPPTAKRPKGRGKDSTRRIAAGMLAQVTRGKTLDEVRDRLDPLAPQERNLADAIVQVSLRHYGEIKIHLAAHMKRALPLRPHIAHALLVTGAAQLLYMNVPPHAAIDETVAATGRQEQPFRGLINAVLRKIAAAKQDGTLPATDAADNLPDWMRARFEAAYGAEGLVAICAQQRLSPALDICFKNPEKAAAWAKERAKNSADKNTDKNNAEKLTETHLRLTAPGAVTKLDGFQDGDWFVQDVAAGWPAAMLLGKLDAPSRVLDLCAAPGGKTLQVAAAGHAVTALIYRRRGCNAFAKTCSAQDYRLSWSKPMRLIGSPTRNLTLLSWMRPVRPAARCAVTPIWRLIAMRAISPSWPICRRAYWTAPPNGSPRKGFWFTRSARSTPKRARRKPRLFWRGIRIFASPDPTLSRKNCCMMTACAPHRRNGPIEAAWTVSLPHCFKKPRAEKISE